MGLFSSSYETYVGTSISRFTDANDFVSSKIKGMISGVNRKEDITEHALENVIASSGFNARKAYRYGGNGYVFGRPSDTIVAKNAWFGIGTSVYVSMNLAIRDYLFSLGAQEIYYTKYGVSNYFHKLYMLLKSSQNFNFDTGELPLLTASKGFTVTLSEVALLINPTDTSEDLDSFEEISFYPAEVKENINISRVGAEITYTWSNGATTFTESLTLSTNFEFSFIELEKTMYMAAYKDVAGQLQFFNYELNTGIPALDNVLNTPYDTPGEYLPWLYFRWDKQPSNTNITSADYLSSKKLAKKIGLNYNEVIEAVHSVEEGRTQEDLNDVDSVFLMYAVPADATDQVEIKYLYRFFEKHYNAIGGFTTDLSLEQFNGLYQKTSAFEHAIIFQDARFKMSLGMSGIWKRVVTGSIGEINTYRTLKGQDVKWNSTTTPRGFTILSPFFYSWHTYAHQVSATQYIEYHVVGLRCSYFVEGNYRAASGYTEDVEDPKDILYIPIDFSLVKDLPIFEEEELMYKGLQIVANSLVVVKVKWYQQDIWGGIFKFIGIVLLIMGFKEGFELFYALAAIASVSVAWAIELIIQYVVQYLLATLAVNLFVTVAGKELAFLAAILATIYGGAKSFGFNAPYATDLLKYANAVFTEVGKSFGKEFAELQSQYTNFIEEAEKEIDEISNLLENFDNPNLKYAQIILGETPTEYYNKIHEGNIGRRVFDVIPNYVEMSLDLSLKPTYSRV
jgi:hypothetical protein